MLGIFEIDLQDSNFEIANVVTICIEMQWQRKKLFLSEIVCVIIKSVSEISACLSNILCFWVFLAISSTALTNNTETSFSLQLSPPRQSTLSMSPLTSMEATFPPKLTQNQQTHTNFFHTTVSILDIISNLLFIVNFYVTDAFP